MSKRIIGLVALIPLSLAIYTLTLVFGMEIAMVIIAAMFLPLLIAIVSFFILLSTIYGVCKIITG